MHNSYTIRVGNGREIDLMEGYAQFYHELADCGVVRGVGGPQLIGSFRLLRAALQVSTELCAFSCSHVVINKGGGHCTSS